MPGALPPDAGSIPPVSVSATNEGKPERFLGSRTQTHPKLKGTFLSYPMNLNEQIFDQK
jgi:hypothetical protein